MNETLKVIASRRSIRKFKDEQIKDEELKLILDAGLMAPSGHNDQSWYFTVLQNKSLIKEVSDGAKEGMRKSGVDWIVTMGSNEKLNIFYNAPTAIIVSAKKDAVTPLADICAAMQNMLLAAESIGIGSCWIGFARFYFSSPESYTRLGIPDGYEAHYGLVLGYKLENTKAVAPPKKYKQYYNIIR